MTNPTDTLGCEAMTTIALRPAAQPSSDAIREHLEGVARRSCTDEQFNAFKWIIDATFESLDLLHATQQATSEPVPHPLAATQKGN